MNRTARRARPVSALSDLDVAAMLRGLAPMSAKLSTNGARYPVRADACDDCIEWKAALADAPAMAALNAAALRRRGVDVDEGALETRSPTAGDAVVTKHGERSLCGLCAEDRALLGRLRRRVLAPAVAVAALEAVAKKKLANAAPPLDAGSSV